MIKLSEKKKGRLSSDEGFHSTLRGAKKGLQVSSTRLQKGEIEQGEEGKAFLRVIVLYEEGRMRLG